MEQCVLAVDKLDRTMVGQSRGYRTNTAYSGRLCRETFHCRLTQTVYARRHILSLRAHSFHASEHDRSGLDRSVSRSRPRKQLTLRQREAMRLRLDWPTSVSLRSPENCIPIWLRRPLWANHGSYVES